jgi:hypothetical protein
MTVSVENFTLSRLNAMPFMLKFCHRCCFGACRSMSGHPTDFPFGVSANSSKGTSMNKSIFAVAAVAVFLAGCHQKPAPVVVTPPPAPSPPVVVTPAPDASADAAKADRAADAAKDASNAAKGAAMDAKDSANKAADAAKDAKK